MKKLLIPLSVLLVVSSSAIAKEGMWLMTQLGDLDLASQGLKVTAEQIYTPGETCLLDAIVNMGGASGAFVSPQGLILTNHHVAFSAIQRASTKGKNYLEEGFVAKSMEDELPAPGSYARIITEIRDVTAEVQAAGAKIKDPVKKRRAILKKMTELEEIERAKGEDIDATVAELYDGILYHLYVYKRFRDIRIVFAPPQSIGNYGSEIDNWMWPRHTGDFTYLRAYVSPDGVSREYSAENVPYQPKKWLKISTDNLNEGDMTFIIGFPGKTDRYASHYDVEFYRDVQYPYSIATNQILIDLIESACDTTELSRIKATGRTRWLYNGMKNNKGVLRGMYAENFLEQKRAFDNDLQAFIMSDRKLRKQYGNLLEEIGNTFKEKKSTIERERVFSLFGRSGAMPLARAYFAYETAREIEKPADQRRADWSKTETEWYKRYYRYGFVNVFEPFERALLRYTLQRANDLPADQRIKAVDDLIAAHGSIDALLEYLFDGTKMMDGSFAIPLLDATSKEIEAIDDPIIRFAVALYPEQDALHQLEETRKARQDELSRQYMEMIEAKNGLPYPDATGTVRFTLGKVEGYSPRDAVVYKPFTTLTGVIEKNTGEEPFDMPPELGVLEKNRDFGIWEDPELKDIPVAFTHVLDITGGNSGSPAFNAKGEMIGIAFDGNFEALLGDWKFQPEINRTISVDTRYVMFLTEKFAKAQWLLDEMGVKTK
ncbi:MAG: S46 family peptidase [bacterium]